MKIMRSPVIFGSRTLALGIAAAALAMPMGAVHAAPAPVMLLAANPPPAVKQNEAVLLRQAYAILSKADHDYKGHRKHAMKQIEAALKVLGTGIQGDGSGGEAQGTSDAQLQAAQGLLENARAKMVSDRQKRAVKHVNAAIKHITAALSIR